MGFGNRERFEILLTASGGNLCRLYEIAIFNPPLQTYRQKQRNVSVGLTAPAHARDRLTHG
jgi:hypothetical protein